MLRKIVTITLPALLAGGLVLALAVEAVVRLRWDQRRGVPGFYVSDPVRVQKLAPGYRGWFAGVPVFINHAGVRADREYSLAKGASTFRILVLGDSVTFGHGSIYEHTYPKLLEDRLRAWQPQVDWQVWNAGVPGYNTSQELAALYELGPQYHPDLVIVGFFENDLSDNQPIRAPSRLARLGSRAKTALQTHVRSLELYKRLYLTLAYRLSASDGYRRMLEHLPTERLLLAPEAEIADLKEQQLTPVRVLTDADVAAVECRGGEKPNPELIPQLRRDPGYQRWIDAVREFQSLHASGAYRIVFFVNIAPAICPYGDAFYDGGSSALNGMFLEELSQGTPAVSSYDAFMHHVPSQMPVAQGHSIGNSNQVKADVLFDFLRTRVLPQIQQPTH